ncbi:MAG: histidine--tRNA ligase, partial [Chloroflexi bacterium]|nr:histidine--tRNA ligase [Chloroflexota bacterium]
IRAVIGFGDRSLRAQLRAADRSGARYALLLGEEEMARGQVTLQDLRSQGDVREAVSQSALVSTLLAKLATEP